MVVVVVVGAATVVVVFGFAVVAGDAGVCVTPIDCDWSAECSRPTPIRKAMTTRNTPRPVCAMAALLSDPSAAWSPRLTMGGPPGRGGQRSTSSSDRRLPPPAAPEPGAAPPIADAAKAAHDERVIGHGVGGVEELVQQLVVARGRQPEAVADHAFLRPRLRPPRTLEIEDRPLALRQCHPPNPATPARAR